MLEVLMLVVWEGVGVYEFFVYSRSFFFRLLSQSYLTLSIRRLSQYMLIAIAAQIHMLSAELIGYLKGKLISFFLWGIHL